jgi:glycosyltransferase involved in cell wall biosynthesis
MSVVVAQLGARMHYAVPRLLERAGLLERFYTDICAAKDWPRLLHLIPPTLRPGGMQRLLGRDPGEIPERRITAFTGFGFEYARRYARARTTDERNTAFLWSGREFGRLVIKRGFGAAKAVYVFNSAGLEILRAARQYGLKGVVEQTIAPRSIEWALLKDEAQRFPGWETPAAKDSMMEDYCAREAAEWGAADLVVCGSEFVREGIINCGGDPAKCVVVPYGLERRVETAPKAPRREGPLRVLTVGAVGLRKGTPYVLEATRQLGARAEFRMVGAVQVLPEAERELRAHVQLTGVVPRTEIAAQYAWADVFLLPSLCEGSATSTYEALFEGLPVLCTPQTGSVVRDGIDGFIVPPRDGAAIAEKLALLADKPELLAQMSENARARSSEFTLEKYGERLIAAFREHGVLRA